MQGLIFNRNGDVLTLDSGVSQPTEDVCFGYYLLPGLELDEHDILTKPKTSRNAVYGILDGTVKVSAQKDVIYQLFVHFWRAEERKPCQPSKIKTNKQFLRVGVIATIGTFLECEASDICAMR